MNILEFDFGDMMKKLNI